MSSKPLKVAIVGASGETGVSIINGLLEKAEEFVALVRPASVEKDEIQTAKARGVSIVPLDADAPHDELVGTLQGQDVLISCVVPYGADLEKSLATAAKAAGIKRFVPSFWASVCPPKGVLAVRETKEEVLNHVKKLHLPYTVIDVGWWYQGSLPRLSSGKIDYMLKMPITNVYGDGKSPSALTDLRDIGKYVARIIADPRTLNRLVFVYNEMWSQEQIFSLLEELSGETVVRNYLSKEEVEKAVEAAEESFKQSQDTKSFILLVINQYMNTAWVRGDNTPETADYLGYLNGKELYPDVSFTPFREFVKAGLDGNGKAPHANRKFAIED